MIRAIGGRPAIVPRWRFVLTEPKCSSPHREVGDGRSREEKLGASRVAERGRKLPARADCELAVDAREVDFNRPLRDKKRLRDLAVRGAFGGHLGNAPFAGRE